MKMAVRIKYRINLPDIGFTLTELMVAVTIIGILATVVIPKFTSASKKSAEATTKGNLGSIRSALTIYYSDIEGQYPTDVLALTNNGKYLKSFPKAKTPGYHSDSSNIRQSRESGGPPGLRAINDGAGEGWAYFNNTQEANFGSFWVNCTHTDGKGTNWNQY